MSAGKFPSTDQSRRVILEAIGPSSDLALVLAGRSLSDQLAAAGVKDGDMLVATEGGATMVAVRCGPLCTVIPVVATATKAHGEGHIAFSLNAALPSPSPSITPGAAAGPGASSGSGLSLGVPIAIGLLLLLMLVAVLGIRAVRRRGR